MSQFSTLIIAEKPSVAQSIAKFLGQTGREKGYLICGDVAVTHAVGHLLEDPMPDYYDRKYATWKMRDLPFVPDRWVKVPRDQVKDQLKVIGNLLRQSARVIHAGDSDDEGQLIVDELLEYFNYQGPVQRLLSGAWSDEYIQRAMNSMVDNRDRGGSRNAALARSRADYLIGVNISRAYALLAKAHGYSGRLSAGRVRNPVMQLCVDVEDAIAGFRPVDHYGVQVRVTHAKGEFMALWDMPADHEGTDVEGRLIDMAVAEQVAAAAAGSAEIEDLSVQRMVEHQPLVYNLTSITKAAEKAFGYSAKQVLEACQQLYEVHKLTTYPRGESEHIPEDQHAEAPKVLAAIAKNISDTAGWMEYADVSIKSPAWNDEHCTVHFGIIPTATKANLLALPEPLRNVYVLIARMYMAQFFPAHEYEKTSVHVRAGASQYLFKASGRIEIENGWKAIFSSNGSDAEEDTEKQKNTLPHGMAEGDDVLVSPGGLVPRRTKPPRRFTEASLMEAMSNVHKYVRDPADKAAIKEGEGIGTPATRTSQVEELQTLKMLTKSRGYLVPTDDCRAVLSLLPAEMKSLSLAAHFQRSTLNIRNADGRGLDEFLNEQVQFIAELVRRAREGMPIVAEYPCEDPVCANEGGVLLRRERKDRKGHFWGCSNFREGCRVIVDDVAGSPRLSRPVAEGAAQ